MEIVTDPNGRWVIKAYIEGGHRATRVDLRDVIRWLKKNMPEVL